MTEPRPAIDNARLKRPAIPSTFYKTSLLGSVAFLTYAACLYLVPASLIYVCYRYIDPLWLQVAAIVPLTVWAAYGYNLVGFVGHEGLHLTLFRSKWLSALTGLFYASSIVSYFEYGFAVQHWNHHRYTNQASDHDIALVSGLHHWWQRLLMARWIYNWEYAKSTLMGALGRPSPFKYGMPFKPERMRWLARANLLFALGWLALYATLVSIDPVASLLCIGQPMLLVLFIAACQTYIDHAGTSEKPFQNAWSRTHPLMTVVYCGANYHLEHHMYPSVPCYRLPALHRHLRDSGAMARLGMPVEDRFLGAYTKLAAPYELGRMDSSFDPFEPGLQEVAVD